MSSDDIIIKSTNDVIEKSINIIQSGIYPKHTFGIIFQTINNLYTLKEDMNDNDINECNIDDFTVLSDVIKILTNGIYTNKTFLEINDIILQLNKVYQDISNHLINQNNESEKNQQPM